MKKYNPKSICEKCGGKDIGSHYTRGCGLSYCTLHPIAIRRWCRRYGYEWDEEPLDVKDGEENERKKCN